MKITVDRWTVHVIRWNSVLYMTTLTWGGEWKFNVVLIQSPVRFFKSS